MKNIIKSIIKDSDSRFSFFEKFINNFQLKEIAEIGLYKADFSEKILKNCPEITKYMHCQTISF